MNTQQELNKDTVCARCGAQGRISTSGLFLTCPKCIELSRTPTREEQLAALYASIAAMKAKSA